MKGNQKLANQYQVKGSPVALIVDPDGQELVRTPLASGGAALSSALDQASAKYQDKEISWGSDLPGASSEKKLLVVGFEDEMGEILKLLEDRRIAKYHGRMTFVRLAYEKGGEAAKKWGVSTLPSLFLCDARKENPEKNVIEKLTGKKNESSLKAAIQRALFKLDARK